MMTDRSGNRLRCTLPTTTQRAEAGTILKANGDVGALMSELGGVELVLVSVWLT